LQALKVYPAGVTILAVPGIGGAAARASDLALLIDKELLAAAFPTDLSTLVGLCEALDAFPHMS